MKTYIICKPTKSGVEFSCKNCGRLFMPKSLQKMTKCPRCDKKFKNIVKIIRGEYADIT